mgnify:CR=1 FL=1
MGVFVSNTPFFTLHELAGVLCEEETITTDQFMEILERPAAIVCWVTKYEKRNVCSISRAFSTSQTIRWIDCGYLSVYDGRVIALTICLVLVCFLQMP